MTTQVPTALIVDDQISVVSLTKNWLEEEGFRVLIAANETEAIRICLQQGRPIHLLLVDLFLPSKSPSANSLYPGPMLNGVQCSRRVAAWQPFIGVIFLSCLFEGVIRSLEDIPLEAGFLRKPFGRNALLDKVYETMTRQRAVPEVKVANAALFEPWHRALSVG